MYVNLRYYFEEIDDQPRAVEEGGMGGSAPSTFQRGTELCISFFQEMLYMN